MSNSSNSNITLNELALMIQRQFESVDQNFKVVREKFESVDQKLDLLTSDVQVLKSDTKSSLRALSGDIAEIKVNLEEQEHERRIHLLELGQKHQDSRIRKVEQTVGLAK